MFYIFLNVFEFLNKNDPEKWAGVNTLINYSHTQKPTYTHSTPKYKHKHNTHEQKNKKKHNTHIRTQHTRTAHTHDTYMLT